MKHTLSLLVVVLFTIYGCKTSSNAVSSSMGGDTYKVHSSRSSGTAWANITYAFDLEPYLK